MKLFKILSHPYTLIICFCCIVISGEHSGGFYAMYILLGLPFGALHALLAVVGILALLISHQFNNREALSRFINVLGLFLLLGSIGYFFWADKKNYNYESFDQFIPLATMILTAFISICFLIGLFFKEPTKKLSGV